jgi:hypothetical protein
MAFGVLLLRALVREYRDRGTPVLRVPYPGLSLTTASLRPRPVIIVSQPRAQACLSPAPETPEVKP